MSITSNQGSDLTALRNDIAALKRDVTGLVGHLKTGIANGAQNATSQMDEGSRRLYRNATVEGGRAAKAIGRRIEQEPLMALLIVLGIGYIGGRLLPR